MRWLEQALSVPPDYGQLHFRVYSEPGMIQSLAACYEKLGDLARARDRNDEFLRLWAKADPNLPLLIEAKAMRERLTVAPAGTGSPR